VSHVGKHFQGWFTVILIIALPHRLTMDCGIMAVMDRLVWKNPQRCMLRNWWRYSVRLRG